MSGRVLLRNWLLAVAVLSGSAAVALHVRAADAPVPGGQGTDTSLPLTDSAVTVRGRGAWADLEITVNQTRDLRNQAVSVTWTGGRPTISGPGRFAGNYLQIMQCWGDDDGTNADNPGPPPEQCVQGAVAGTYGGIPGGLFPPGYTLERIIGRTDFANYDASIGVTDASTGFVWRAFQPVDGSDPVTVHTNPNFDPSVVGGQYWYNPYFNIVTTNEIAGGITGPDGSGAELIEMQTGVENNGLGCGRRVQPDGAGKKIPTCWIVVVPRGTPSEENVGTPYEDRADQFGVTTSPLAPAAWANRIAIPMEFTPVDSPCPIGATERRLVGNELVQQAIASWQPALCTAGGLPPYSYGVVSDGAARQQIVLPSAGSPGMVVVNRPIRSSSSNPKNPVVYAPLTASGLVIGFNLERSPNASAPPEEEILRGVRVANINLTPRLVAKLLTQSYTSQTTIIAANPYDWDVDNPTHLGADEDFLRFNPEFRLLEVLNQRTFGGLQLAAGSSDAALQVWEWILADPEARAWLEGAPDEWGMRVNPFYAAKAELNSAGATFGTPLPTTFPKLDSYCYQAPTRSNGVVPAELCGGDWVPYVRSFLEAARVTRSAADRPRIAENTFAQTASDAWSRENPQTIGQRSILALTDTASARQYGLQVASLSRAGDTGPDRTFVAPDAAGLRAGLATMAERDVAGVLEPSPAAVAPGAYPLTTLSYAAIAPLALDTTARDQYAAFVEYATGAGQQPGSDVGALPPGYVPLTSGLLEQAATATRQIRELTKPVDPEPATTTTTTTTTTTAAPASTTAAAPVTTATPVFTPAGGGGTTGTGGGGTGRGGTATATTVAATTPASDVPPSSAPPTSEAPATSEVPTTAAVTTSSVAVPTTPGQDVQVSRFAVPLLGGVALASALLALEITKRPRRAISLGDGAGPSREPEVPS